MFVKEHGGEGDIGVTLRLVVVEGFRTKLGLGYPFGLVYPFYFIFWMVFVSSFILL
jgi:hypothetical protein